MSNARWVIFLACLIGLALAYVPMAVFVWIVIHYGETMTELERRGGLVLAFLVSLLVALLAAHAMVKARRGDFD